MNTLWLRICFLCLGLIPFAVDGSAQSRLSAMDETEVSVRAAAIASLNTFLNKIPQGREIEYGFTNRDAFERADLGTPVRIFTLDPDFLKNGMDQKNNYMIPLDEWRVPIIVDDEFCSLLTVAMVDNTLKTVELGGKMLAKEMMEFWKKDPIGRKGLLRLYQLRCDFMILDRNRSGVEQGEIYPLRSADSVFNDLNCGTSNPCSKSDLYPRIQKKFAEEQKKNR